MIKIDIVGSNAYLSTPYNVDFITAIKQVRGARWSKERQAWVISAKVVDQAREIMRRIYGADDRPSSEPMVNVRLVFEKTVSKTCEPITIFGKTISKAWGRDSGARAGDDVVFVSGSPESGGSIKRWASVVGAESVVVLHNVPQAALQMPVPDGVTFTIESQSPNRNALEKEREQLLKRLAEIDELLKQISL